MTLKPETKICLKCGKEKPLNDFHKKFENKDGFNSRCKICRNEYGRKYRKKNQIKLISYNKLYREQNQDYYLKYKKKYREQNQDKIFEYNKKYGKQNIDKIKDNYIKRLLYGNSGIKFQDITSELIEAKREQIKLFRLIKQIKNELRNENKGCVTS